MIKQSQNKNIYRFKIIAFFLIMPFLEPVIFREYTNIHKVYMIFKMLSASLIFINYLFYYLLKNNKMSKTTIIIIIYELEIICSTFLHNGDILNALNSAISIVTIVLLIEYSFKIDSKVVIGIIYYVFGFYTIINFINVLSISALEDHIYFLGIDNRFVFVYLPMICFGGIYNNLSNKNNKLLYFFIFISFVTLIYRWSVGAFLGISMLFIYIVFILNNSKRKKTLITYDIYFILIIILNILVIFFNIQEIFSNIIIDVLHKDVTLSARTILWERGVYYIKNSLFFGYGVNSEFISTIIYGLAHFHNLFINITFQGGIISLGIFIVLNFYVSKRLKKYKNLYTAKLLSFVLFISLLLSIVDTLDYTYLYVFYLLAGNINKISVYERDKNYDDK